MDLKTNNDSGAMSSKPIPPTTVDHLLGNISQAVIDVLKKAAQTGWDFFPPHTFNYKQDNLATVNNPYFLHYPSFATAYSAGKATGQWEGVDIKWRAHVACWAAHNAAKLQGDFVDLGVFHGGLAALLFSYLGPKAFKNRFYHLVDSWSDYEAGLLCEAEINSGIKPPDYNYEDCFNEVKRNFKLSLFKIHRGRVPEILHLIDSRPLAYISINMACAAVELAGAERLWPSLVKGGSILLDDFAFPGHQT